MCFGASFPLTAAAGPRSAWPAAPPSIPPSTPAFSPSLGHTRLLSQGLCSGSFYVRKPRCCHPSSQNHSPAPYGNCCPQKLPLEPLPPPRSYDLPTGLTFKACFPPDSAPSSTWPVCPLPGPGLQATLSHRGRGEWTRCAKPRSRGRPQAEKPPRSGAGFNLEGHVRQASPGL